MTLTSLDLYIDANKDPRGPYRDAIKTAYAELKEGIDLLDLTEIEECLTSCIASLSSGEIVQLTDGYCTKQVSGKFKVKIPFHADIVEHYHEQCVIDGVLEMYIRKLPLPIYIYDILVSHKDGGAYTLIMSFLPRPQIGEAEEDDAEEEVEEAPGGADV